jgi:hypothetical protein
LIQKNKGRKSRDTVPLNVSEHQFKINAIDSPDCGDGEQEELDPENVCPVWFGIPTTDIHLVRNYTPVNRDNWVIV